MTAPKPTDMPPIKAPIELRSAAVDNVDFAERIITVIAVPYEQPAEVRFNDDWWQEIFERGAFNGIETRQRLSVNRDHDKTRTVGKAIGYWPDRDEGLVIANRMSKTPLGDETLQLASDDCLSASVGFGVRAGDQLIDRGSKIRRIKRAFLDHLAFVPDPAYVGAKVISVRDPWSGPECAVPTATPLLDEWLNDPVLSWSAQRLEQRATDSGPPKPYGNVTYADPKNGKYPIDTEAHARAALSYFSMPKNHAGYTAEEISAIMGRIRAACKRFGIQLAD